MMNFWKKFAHLYDKIKYLPDIEESIEPITYIVRSDDLDLLGIY
jgi:hypothetical protein